MERRMNLRPRRHPDNEGPYWMMRGKLFRKGRVLPRLFPMLPLKIKDRIGAR